jgi:hypothetical protein
MIPWSLMFAERSIAASFAVGRVPAIVTRRDAVGHHPWGTIPRAALILRRN